MATDETTGAAPVEPTPPTAPEAPATPPAPAQTAGQQVGQTLDQAASQLNQAFSGPSGNQSNYTLMIVLSIFLPWLVMILNKQTVKGIVFAVLTYGTFITIIGPAVIGLFAIVDSIILTNRRAKGETFGEWDFFWKPAPSHV
jgi:hypothetical protein